MRWDAHRILEWARLLIQLLLEMLLVFSRPLQVGKHSQADKTVQVDRRKVRYMYHHVTVQIDNSGLICILSYICQIVVTQIFHLKKLFQQGPCGVRQDVLRMNERTKNEVQKV